MTRSRERKCDISIRSELPGRFAYLFILKKIKKYLFYFFTRFFAFFFFKINR